MLGKYRRYNGRDHDLAGEDDANGKDHDRAEGYLMHN
jgi:hypothetical protein